MTANAVAPIVADASAGATCAGGEVAIEAEFFHVRVLIGMITGLTIARLLNGLSRLVQQPARAEAYSVRLAWTAFLMLAVTNFWWFELGLSSVRWDALSYYFVVIYASLYFFAATLLFPDRADHAGGVVGYFHARQHLFYAILAAILVLDLGDTLLKGPGRMASLGTSYPWRNLAVAALAVAVMRARDWRWHLGLATLAIASELVSVAAEFARD